MPHILGARQRSTVFLPCSVLSYFHHTIPRCSPRSPLPLLFLSALLPLSLATASPWSAHSSKQLITRARHPSKSHHFSNTTLYLPAIGVDVSKSGSAVAQCWAISVSGSLLELCMHGKHQLICRSANAAQLHRLSRPFHAGNLRHLPRRYASRQFRALSRRLQGASTRTRWEPIRTPASSGLGASAGRANTRNGARQVLFLTGSATIHFPHNKGKIPCKAGTNLVVVDNSTVSDGHFTDWKAVSTTLEAQKPNAEPGTR